MTGHGQALVQDSQVRVLAEVRSVNNRFLKTNITSDLDVDHQSRLESLVKKYVHRGSVNLKVKSQFLEPGESFKLNEPVLRAYWLQLSEIAGNAQSINIEALLQLPGVVQDSISDGHSENVWPTVERAVDEALQKLTKMRAQEGAVMQANMLENCREISSLLDEIESLAPDVVKNYSKKIGDRINTLLAKHDISAQPADVIKEVGIFADRVDISEETVRLRIHVKQFELISEMNQSNGRKLDFLVQEMLRETNTIGSKANDAGIASHVISIKTAIERIREMVQNIE